MALPVSGGVQERTHDRRRRTAGARRLGVIAVGVLAAALSVGISAVPSAAALTAQESQPAAAAPELSATLPATQPPVGVAVPTFVGDTTQAAAPAQLTKADDTPVSPGSTTGTAPDEGNEIIVTARQSSRIDPLAKLNAQSFAAIQAIDKAVVAPVALGYASAVPKPVRNGLRNLLRNLDEPVSFLNDILQLKIGRAAKSAARFGINSTIGVGGLFDMARRKPFNLPYRPNSFANTFACYGVGNGPFFYLPLVGPTTLRDLFGLGLDKAVLPTVVGKPFDDGKVNVALGVVDILTDRVEIDGQLQRIRNESGDPYVAVREVYLAQRRAEIGAICPRHGDTDPDPNLISRVGKGPR